MQINRRWPIDWSSDWTIRDPARDRASAMLVPEFPVPQGMRAEAAALLPNSRYNANLLASLTERPTGSISAVIATVFAADPFLNVAEYADSLKRCGIYAVANLPTIRQFGTLFCDDADNVGLGPSEEVARMHGFAQSGLQVWLSVTDVNMATDIVDSGASGLIAVVPEADQPASTDRTKQLNTLCEQIQAQNNQALPVLALLGERTPAFRSSQIAGAIRYR